MVSFENFKVFSMFFYFFALGVAKHKRGIKYTMPEKHGSKIRKTPLAPGHKSKGA